MLQTRHLLRAAQSQKELFPVEHATQTPVEFIPLLGGQMAGNSGVAGGGLTKNQKEAVN